MRNISEIFRETFDYGYKNTEYIYTYSDGCVTPLWRKNAPLSPDQFNNIVAGLSKGDYVKATCYAYYENSDGMRRSVDVAKVFVVVDSWEPIRTKFLFKYTGGNIYGTLRGDDSVFSVFRTNSIEYGELDPSDTLMHTLGDLANNYINDGSYIIYFDIDLIQPQTEKDMLTLNREIAHEYERRKQ